MGTNLTGLIITKLDSTAKGGVVLAHAKYKLPIVAIGMGEKRTTYSLLLNTFRRHYWALKLKNLLLN